MKRYTFVFLGLLLFSESLSVFCLDYKNFILNSDRSGNALILQLLLTNEFETQLTICKALGQRQDMEMDDFITSLLDFKIPALQTELLLEVLLHSLLNSDYLNEKIELWINLNPVSFPQLVKSLSSYKNENLKIHIIHILRFAEEKVDIKHYLMSEAQSVLTAIKKQRGQVTLYQKKELNEVLETIDWWEDKDFFEFCVTITETCMDKELVKKALELAKKKLAGLKPLITGTNR